MAEINAVEGNEPKERKAVVRAAVAYPYFDLSDSLEVAKAIHDKAGGSCGPDNLAAYLDYKSTKSGTYLTRISAAKQFGLIRSENGSIAVTERAMQILSPVLPEDAVNARADAFLGVELFGKIYERFKNTTIPPKIGMRNLLQQTFGLSADRVDPAVRVLFDSAEQAGFFQTSGDQTRLIRPIAKVAGKSAQPEQKPQEKQDSDQRQHHHAGGTSGGGDGPPGIHTAIIGLLRELPAPGTVWPDKQKQRFVTAFKATLDFIYPSDAEENGGDDLA